MEKASLPELYELLHRQEKLLANKSFIQKLPDQGKKIKIKHQKILEQIEKFTKIDESCKLFSTLTINSPSTISKKELENFEWRTGSKVIEYLDSDDDSEPEDPLSVLASSSNVKKRIVVIEEERKLITEEDLKEIAQSQLSSKDREINHLDGHNQYITEKTKKSNLVIKNSFKPHKTLIKSSLTDSNKGIAHKKDPKWENTAATFPPLLHDTIKEISLQESLELHNEHTQQLKEIQLKRASEKLALQASKIPQSNLKITDNKYREVVETESDTDKSDGENSDQEVHDEESKDGGVVFTVYD